MKTPTIIFAILLSSAVASPFALPIETLQPAPDGGPPSSRAKDDSLYSDGTRAINESRWADAETTFAKTVAMHGGHEEGAMYWQAYAQAKQGQSGRALATCGTLQQKHPDSRWNDECG